MRIPLLAGIASALFIWFTGDMLPATVASHFGASGEANGFLSRSAYLVTMAAVVVFLPMLIGGVGRWVGVMPDDLINLPNKEYWLAPGRREQTLAALTVRLQWFSLGLSVFLCYVHWLVVQANQLAVPRLDNGHIFSGLVIFLVCALAWIVLLYRRFGAPPEAR